MIEGVQFVVVKESDPGGPCVLLHSYGMCKLQVKINGTWVDVNWPPEATEALEDEAS